LLRATASPARTEARRAQRQIDGRLLADENASMRADRVICELKG
jgi:hypothetical protein